MENKAKKLVIILGVIVVVVLAVIVASQKKNDVKSGDNINAKTGQPSAAETINQEGNIVTAPLAEILKDSRVEAPNANPITTENKVVTADGKPTLNNVSQTSPRAPAETGPITIEQVAANAIKLEISAAGYNPKEFTVKPGAPITIAVTSIDKYAHSFVFEDPSLSAIGVGVYGGETRAITFNAPTKAGEYTFFCNVGRHRDRGEAGKMIVK